MCLRKMPGRLADPERAARRARRPGVVSFGYFSLHKQRKVTRAEARNAFEQKQSHWVPTFAGMTVLLVART